MSNDANALKRKEQIKKILVYGGMVMLCLVSFYFIFKPSKEHCSLTRTVAGSEQHMTSERWERLSAVEVPFTLYLLISVLVIDTAAPAGHIDRVVIEQFKLTIQLCNIVTGSCSRIENLVFEPAEDC